MKPLPLWISGIVVCSMLVVCGLSPVSPLGTRAQKRVAAPSSTQREVLDALRQRVIPIRSIKPQQDVQDILPLAHAVGDAQVVGLGEPSHGTSESYLIRQRIVQLLVQEMGFRLLAIEGHNDFASALDRYIKGAEMGDLVGFDGIFGHEEFWGLLGWMRAYNQHVPASRQLSIAAFDLQRPNFEIEALTAYLARIGASAIAQKAFAPLQNLDYASLPAATKAACREALKQVVSVLERNQPALSAGSSPREYQTMHHYALMLQQTEAVLAGFDTDMTHSFNVRDAQMARNVRFLQDVAYPGQKIILLAHNAHVGRSSDHRPEMKHATALGEHLHRRLGERYFAVGFTMFRGSLRAVSYHDPSSQFVPHKVRDAKPESASALFKQTGLPSFLLLLRGTDPQSPLGRWGSEVQAIRSFPAAYDPQLDELYYERVKPAEQYDGLIYNEESTPTRTFN